MKSNDTALLLSKYIAPGSRIELEAIDRVLQEDGSYKRKKFDSKVVDVIDDETLEILMPMELTNIIGKSRAEKVFSHFQNKSL